MIVKIILGDIYSCPPEGLLIYWFEAFNGKAVPFFQYYSGCVCKELFISPFLF